MPKKTEEQVIAELRERGICRGMSVSWVTPIGNKRYGCVMGFSELMRTGKVDIQAMNGQFPVSASILKPEPECGDPVMADYHETYGKEQA